MKSVLKSQTSDSPLATGAKKPCFMISAGEASSDLHAANLAKELLRQQPNAEIFGMGGSSLRAAGIETVVDSEEAASVMGFSEVLFKLGDLIGALNKLKRVAAERKPDVLILVDFPDFNYFLAKGLKRRFGSNIKVFHFITPTIWAWRQGRIKTVQKYVDKVAPIFPFEEKYFKEHGVDAEYVGHPFLDSCAEVEKGSGDFLSSLGLSSDSKLLGLLPGSRKAEISNLLPVMLESFELLQKRYPDIRAILPVATSLDRGWLESLVGGQQGVVLVDGQASEVLRNVDAAIVASGTVTVEAAIAKCPMVVIYKLSGMSYFIAKNLVKGVKSFAMPNIIAGKKIVPELLQEEVTADRIYKNVEKYFDSSDYRQLVKNYLSEVAEQLSVDRLPRAGNSAATRAASIALELAGCGEVNG